MGNSKVWLFFFLIVLFYCLWSILLVIVMVRVMFMVTHIFTEISRGSFALILWQSNAHDGVYGSFYLFSWLVLLATIFSHRLLIRFVSYIKIIRTIIRMNFDFWVCSTPTLCNIDYCCFKGEKPLGRYTTK